jgi:hypothetical protein
MNAIEKGKTLMDHLMWFTEAAYAKHVVEQTAKAYAVEELQKIAGGIKRYHEPYEIKGDIEDRIRELREENSLAPS